MVTHRDATAEDLPRINDIYNHYVTTSTCTYQEEPETIESRRDWFSHHGETLPVIVAEIDGRVAGWGSLSPFRERSAYRYTVENSVYVDEADHRRGVGLMLMEELIARARAIGYRTIVAGIDADQPASIALHTRLGFVPAARLSEVGYKFGRWLDVVYLQLML
jgi:L-amino acid N-acyltransferase